MAADTGRVVMVLLSFGFAAVVPIVGGSLWSIWRTSVEQRQVMALEQLERDHAADVVPEAAPPPPPAPTGPPTPESMLSFVAELNITAELRGDALPDQPFRIALEGTEGQLPTGATVDLGRDGTIDEVWALPRGVPPTRELRGPDGKPTQRLVLAGNVWIREGEAPPPEPPALPPDAAILGLDPASSTGGAPSASSAAAGTPGPAPTP